MKGRILGIDFGMARLGLALSDESKTIASSWQVFKAEKKTEETCTKLLELVQKHQNENHYVLEEIVVGLPLMMSGKVGFLADEVKHFVELLKQLISIPIHTWDERLTTVLAERSMREGGLSRKRRAKSVDTLSAVIILQNYLDWKKTF